MFTIHYGYVAKVGDEHFNLIKIRLKIAEGN